MGLENPLHIAIILVVVLMVFGAKRLPEMGKGLGEGMRGFKQGISGDGPKHVVETESAPAAQPAPLSLSAAPAPVSTPAAERESAPVA